MSNQRVCFVLDEQLSQSANVLAECGYVNQVLKTIVDCVGAVDLVSVGPISSSYFSHCGDVLASVNIVDLINEFSDVTFSSGVWGVGKGAYLVHEYLKSQSYTHVISLDREGVLFYTLQARQLGLGFGAERFIVLGLNPSIRKNTELANWRPNVDLLGVSFMERRVVELADTVMCEADYASWYEQKIDSTFSPTNLITPDENIELNGYVVDNNVNEVVFITDGVNGYESNNDLYQIANFLDANPEVKLTFLSVSVADDNFLTLVDRRLSSYKARIARRRCKTVFDATAYLIETNSRLLLKGSNFSHRGLAKQIIDSGGQCLTFDSTLEEFEKNNQSQQYSLTESINAALNVQHQKTATNFAASASVTVCVVHHERPDFLARTLRSLSSQNYDNFDVVVVDDGSSSTEAIEAFDNMKWQYETRGWRFKKTRNSWLGHARNYAASFSNSDYLIFMDDDNIATSFMVSKYVNAIQYAKQDALTCFAGTFSEYGCGLYEDDIPPVDCDFLPLGDAAALACYTNMIGDANCIVKRSSFNAVNGFWQHYMIGYEDHEFYMRLLDKGYEIKVLPERLFYYRKSTDGMLANSRDRENYSASVKLIFSNVGDSFYKMMSHAEKQLLLYLIVFPVEKRKILSRIKIAIVSVVKRFILKNS